MSPYLLATGVTSVAQALEDGHRPLLQEDT